MTDTFSHFVGIDWSGAKGKRHKGISVAICERGNDAPVLVTPLDGKPFWSREGVQDWISAGTGLNTPKRVLVGLDSAFSMPFVDEGGYLGNALPIADAPELWSKVNSACQGAGDLFGGPFVEHFADHYHRPKAKGHMFRRRMRVTEDLAVATKAGPCESVFHLIGPSQVGLSGLSTMRMLANLKAQQGLAVWPYQPLESASTVLVEIYAAAFAAQGGHRGKVRCTNDLNKVLQALGSAAWAGGTSLTDHDCDALITAAALRKISGERKYWHPPQLSTKVRRTEGWVFGIV